MTDTRFAKADAARFNGAPAINKLKADTIALAGDHAEWAQAFAESFTAALPHYEWGTAKHWLVGVKIAKREPDNEHAPYFLRLKVSNGGKGADDKRRWVYVTLGSKVHPGDLARETALKMEDQPGKTTLVDSPTGPRKFGWAADIVG